MKSLAKTPLVGLILLAATACGSDKGDVESTRTKQEKSRNLAAALLTDGSFSPADVEAFDQALDAQNPPAEQGWGDPLQDGWTGDEPGGYDGADGAGNDGLALGDVYGSTYYPVPGVSTSQGGITGGVGPGIVTVSGGVTNGNGVFSATGTTSYSAPIFVSVPKTPLANLGIDIDWDFVRSHEFYISGNAKGNVGVSVTGNLTATANSWSVTIAANGTGNAKIYTRVDQYLRFPVLRRRTGWYFVGDASISVAASASDSVTYTQTCNPAGQMMTTQGPTNAMVNAQVNGATFAGVLFPNLTGVVANGLRNIIASFVVNLANAKLPGIIQSQVFQANATYSQQKAALLAELLKKIPAGLGCNVLPPVIGVIAPPTATTPTATPTPIAPVITQPQGLPMCTCSELANPARNNEISCYIRAGDAGTNQYLGPRGASSCAQMCSTAAATGNYGCRY